MVKEPTKETEVWARLGGLLTLHPGEADILFKGDEESRKLLLKILSERRFSMSGETYIPNEAIGDYNDENQTDHVVDDDIFDF